MWCQECRQDVPAVSSPELGQYRCPRCSGMFALDQSKADSHGQQQAGLAEVETVLAGEHGPLPPVFDGWELGEQLKHVERVLAAEAPPRDAGPGPVFRMDHAHESGEWHLRSGDEKRRRRRGTAPRSRLRVLIWLLLSLGLMAFVCGGVLVGWSLAAGRNELWYIGLPIALAGQIGLLAGLVLQIQRIWEDHRAAAAKRDRFDEELHHLKTYGKNAFR